jgi:transcription elongation factor GreB
MSRWRPPPESSTAIITRAGYERLREEFNELWKVRRPEVVKALSEAAPKATAPRTPSTSTARSSSARSTGACATWAKRLESLKVAEEKPSDPSAIYFGASFELENADSGELGALSHRRPGRAPMRRRACSASTRRWHARVLRKRMGRRVRGRAAARQDLFRRGFRQLRLARVHFVRGRRCRRVSSGFGAVSRYSLSFGTVLRTCFEYRYSPFFLVRRAGLRQGVRR